MITGASSSQLSPSGQGALHVLEVFSRSAGLAFDRTGAVRVLAESQQAISGEGPRAWYSRLVEAGESVNLRIRSIECTLREALQCVEQGVPVALCTSGSKEPLGGADSTDEDLSWAVLSELKGRKVRVSRLDTHEGGVWLSFRQLRKALGLETMASTSRWIIGQAALGCESPDQWSTDGTKEPIPPLRRLLSLMRPEKTDLWVVLVFSVVVGVLTLATPIAVEALVNTVAFGKYLQPVVILAFMLFVFLGFAAGMRGLMTFVVEIVQRRLFVRTVSDLAYRLPRVQQEQFDRQHGPEAVNRFFDVVTLQKATSALVLDGITIVLQTVIGMAVLAFYHPFLLGFDAFLLLMIGLIVFVLGRGAVRTALIESKAKYDLAAWLQELARHPMAFKMHAGSQFAQERADALAVNWLDKRRAHFRIAMRQILFALGLQAFASAALLGLGGWLVIQGELTLGQLVAAELIVMMILGSFAKLGKQMERFYDLLASVDKLGHLFDLSTERHDKLFHLSEGGPASVSVCEASYQYNGKPGLSSCVLELQPGESVALTGPAGSGKSTLIDLICGLRQPSSGHIELDRIDLRELRPDSLREHLAVSRSVEIFHGTIDENVNLNRSNVRANDVRDALASVGLLDEILKLPDGMNTVLQTNGAPLTQSQTARLMLARAIVGRPRLLLIDGTLDTLPDRELDEVMQQLTDANSPWTLLVCTGRRQVIEACDRTASLVKPPSSSSDPADESPAPDSSPQGPHARPSDVV